MIKNRADVFGKEEDTIVAISTPPGIGGISIVRMSGPLSIEIASKIFLYQGKVKKSPHEFHSHRIYYGTIIQPGEGALIDEVLLVVMRKPKTYTREDIVEINCHGGYLVVNKVLEIVIKMGARIAEAGE
ncbi:MAG TPA: tRNA uridine-5-carboxymethylaminomethyl(34) synthesis GTPase MnmE, partial [Atribacterota bacterium]|nr:tRNA uridine-5-carboxymethylaminomethyl(34) synthesis GTPase MnmE [Atribacterota bacterium]